MYILTNQVTKTHCEMLFFVLNFGGLAAWWERNHVTLVCTTKIHYWNRDRDNFFLEEEKQEWRQSELSC